MGLSQTERDLRGHLQREMEGLFARHLNVANIMLGPVEMARLALYVASNVTMGMIGVVIQYNESGDQKSDIYDLCAASVAKHVADMKPDVIAHIAEEQAKLQRERRR